MHPALDWQEDDLSSALMFSTPPDPPRPARPVRLPGELPMAVAAAILSALWLANRLVAPIGTSPKLSSDGVISSAPGGIDATPVP